MFELGASRRDSELMPRSELLNFSAYRLKTDVNVKKVKIEKKNNRIGNSLSCFLRGSKVVFLRTSKAMCRRLDRVSRFSCDSCVGPSRTSKVLATRHVAY